MCPLAVASRQRSIPLTQADKQTAGVMAVFGYIRVSTLRQVEDGESPDIQERTIAGYAMMNGLKVSQTFVEGSVSGSVPLDARPQG
jgi:putative DNA-invertase from lambdoid prophage Rac